MNAHAGAFKSTTSTDQMRELAESVGLDAEIITTESVPEMLREIKKLVDAGADRVGIAGGDGTIGKAVQELAHKQTALGIIPQGTFNNFATALRLPSDLPSSLRVLKEGEVQEVSLGKVGDKYFTEVAGVGLFADVLSLYGRGTNKSFLRGLYAFMKVFFAMRTRRMRLTLDGKVIEERAVWCTVANSYRMAQGLAIAPEAKLTDDVLDVVMVGDIARFEFVRYYRALRAQLHSKLPKVSIVQAKEVKIETYSRANVHADDDVIATTPVTIEVQPKALRVLVDRL
jgi:diacylglycerol kinase (ATP)